MGRMVMTRPGTSMTTNLDFESGAVLRMLSVDELLLLIGERVPRTECMIPILRRMILRVVEILNVAAIEVGVEGTEMNSVDVHHPGIDQPVQD